MISPPGQVITFEHFESTSGVSGLIAEASDGNDFDSADLRNVRIEAQNYGGGAAT